MPRTLSIPEAADSKTPADAGPRHSRPSIDPDRLASVLLGHNQQSQTPKVTAGTLEESEKEEDYQDCAWLDAFETWLVESCNARTRASRVCSERLAKVALRYALRSAKGRWGDGCNGS